MIFSKEQLKIVEPLKKKYSIKNLRTFRGMEGTGVNSTLYENGKKLCNVDDDGNGGCLNFYEYSVEEKIEKELKNVGKVKYDETDTYEFTYDAEMLLNELIDRALEDKQFKTKCKRNTLIVTTKCKRGQHIEFSIPFNTITSRKCLEKRYGDELVEIINERYL
jgi:uncharacterized membrane protein YfhO